VLPILPAPRPKQDPLIQSDTVFWDFPATAKKAKKLKKIPEYARGSVFQGRKVTWCMARKRPRYEINVLGRREKQGNIQVFHSLFAFFAFAVEFLYFVGQV
jgi:hypothetical protein